MGEIRTTCASTKSSRLHSFNGKQPYLCHFPPPCSESTFQRMCIHCCIIVETFKKHHKQVFETSPTPRLKCCVGTQRPGTILISKITAGLQRGNDLCPIISAASDIFKVKDGECHRWPPPLSDIQTKPPQDSPRLRSVAFSKGAENVHFEHLSSHNFKGVNALLCYTWDLLIQS